VRFAWLAYLVKSLTKQAGGRNCGVNGPTIATCLPLTLTLSPFKFSSKIM